MDSSSLEDIVVSIEKTQCVFNTCPKLYTIASWQPSCCSLAVFSVGNSFKPNTVVNLILRNHPCHYKEVVKNQRQMVGLLLDFPHYLISHKRNPGRTSWLRSATGMPDWGTNFYWEKSMPCG